MTHPYKKYWEERMQQRMHERHEVTRLFMTLKGFFLDSGKEYNSLSDFYHESERPYGNKYIEESVVFHLGWDRDRILYESTLPQFVEVEAKKIHLLVGNRIKEEENDSSRSRT